MEVSPGLAMLAAGPFIGSLLGVLIRRLPLGRSVFLARSDCPDCGARLGAGELVPLLSFVVQRGRCRRCGGRIDPFYWQIELAALAVAAGTVLAAPDNMVVVDCVLGWTLLALAWTDVETMLLPDALTLPLLLAGLAEAWWFSPWILTDRAIGAGLGWGTFAGLAWLWRRWRGIDALGGGDAKLLAAGGAWLGWQALPWVVLVAALMGIAAVLARDGMRPDPTRRIAFGPFLAASIWLMRLYG